MDLKCGNVVWVPVVIRAIRLKGLDVSTKSGSTDFYTEEYIQIATQYPKE